MRAFFRTASRVAVAVGAAGSLALMLRVGQRQNSWLLLGLFTGWVLSPFVGLALASAMSTRWSALTRTTLYGVTIIVTLCSLIVYARPPAVRPASIFLLVPLGSWLLMAIAIPLAAYASGRPTGQDP